MQYGAELKARMGRRMTGRRGSARRCCRVRPASRSRGSRSCCASGTGRPVPPEERPPRSPGQNMAKRPRDWTAAEKLDAVVEASRPGEAELGEFWRARGLRHEHIEQWPRVAEGVLGRRGLVGACVRSTVDGQRVLAFGPSGEPRRSIVSRSFWFPCSGRGLAAALHPVPLGSAATGW